MIKANFNTYASYVTDSLYQWDINQVLSVSGLNLAVVPEVHFSNAKMDRAIVRQATMVDHVVSVAIPNSLLQDPLTIRAHIGIYEGNTFKVVELVEIPIVARKRPSDYQIEDADEEIYSFKALENHIANMVKLSEFNANNATIAARIDNIIAHNNDTNGNTELVDMRTRADGTVHAAAGNALRDLENGNISDLKDVSNILKYFLSKNGDVKTIAKPSDFVYDGYRLSSTKGNLVTSAMSVNEVHTDFIPVTPGRWYLIALNGTGGDRGACGYSAADESSFVATLHKCADNIYEYRYTLVKMSADVNYIRVGTDRVADAKVYDLGENTVETMLESIRALDSEITILPGETLVYIDSVDDLIYGYYLNDRGGKNPSNYGDYVLPELVEIEPNSVYEWTGKFNDARTICQYDENQNFIKAYKGSDVGNPSKFTFRSEPNARYFNASVYGLGALGYISLVKEKVTATTKVLELEERVTALENVVIEDFEFTAPTTIFDTYNDGDDGFYSRGYVQAVYPESFLKTKTPIGVNGRQNFNFACTTIPTDDVSTDRVEITLEGDGYESHNVTFDVVTTKSSVSKDKKVRYLAIGDSLTGNNIADVNGSRNLGGNMQGCVMELQKMDAADLGAAIDFLSVGAYNIANKSVNYKGVDLDFKVCDEGRGSWTTSNYLRHCCHTTTTSSGSGSSLSNKAAWDFAGLGRKIGYDMPYDETYAYEEYDNTTAQRQLINDTPHGRYHWDYSEELFWFLKSMRPGFFENVTAYANTTEVKAAIDNAMTAMLETPDNPFFNLETARTTLDYAFSLSTYLERYRTLDDVTGERLIVGETAGSRITDTNLEKIDLCTPTHITIELGENDRWWYPSDSNKSASDNLKIIEAIHAEYPDIHVGFFTTRMMGVFYPELWNSEIIAPSMAVNSNVFKYELNAAMQTALGTLDNQIENNAYFIPCYFVHSPLSFSTTKASYNLATGESVYVAKSGDINHSGRVANLSMGYQILSWIYYTLAQT